MQPPASAAGQPERSRSSSLLSCPSARDVNSRDRTESDATRGVPEAEIIREGIHLAAMSNRVWDSALDWPTFDGTGKTATSDEVTETVAQAADST